ncbi:hypothetical protein PF010_g215 [Phytophthora fragariae]|uniref:Uncharacterized protein n=1 Tax=Phytophthora fragariae TaxID=53985 RepID=A0A6A3TS92_9STRA|nr:hypothetical protein PF003_g8296 [Phytophthora fragariae]KAE8950060.1 hypothetical protein PF009_g441 [Phytophthora fragariae]KAE9140357.1 hypothetical protein PF010_g215 [Phytophthora fragariae]KAE9141057.1 hypothetical protein PF007_g403 [Phytophthora fragariae]KAE9155946.1 hypothetical protein PF006_g170 [Phytophthora fragariae]
MDMSTRTAVEEFLGTWHAADKTDEMVLELTRFQMFRPSSGSRRCGAGSFVRQQAATVLVLMRSQRVSASQRCYYVDFALCDFKFSFGTQFFYIHSKLRNPQPPDRVEKLVHIFFNAMNINAEERVTYSHLEDLLRGEQDDEGSESSRGDDVVYN